MANETFTLTLDDIPSVSASVTINDTSQTPAAGEQILTSNGSFVVPANVTTLSIFMVGGGGGGMCGQYSSGSGRGGGGGAYYGITDLTVQAGDVFTVQVGGAGLAGYCSTNSPFETVNGSSNYYPQAGSVTNSTSGGNTQITWARSGTDLGTALCGGGASGYNNGGGGSSSIDTVFIDNSVSYVGTGSVLRANASAPTSTKASGGGGGGGYGGKGGQGIGQFHRSTGGYNYYKAQHGGNGGGMRLYGGTNVGSTGSDAPALGTSNYNYSGAGDGGDGGTATGSAFGFGGGGGAGGMIRDQTIYSYGSQYRYRWFLAGSGENGGGGAVRFAYGG